MQLHCKCPSIGDTKLNLTKQPRLDMGYMYHNLICRGLPNGCPCVHAHFTKLAKSDRIMTLSETFHVYLYTATGLTSTKLDTKHHAQVK